MFLFEKKVLFKQILVSFLGRRGTIVISFI